METSVPYWQKLSLSLAALYNLLWGTWVVVFPEMAFALFGMEPPRYLEIWQCVGMIVGVYGIGYGIAAYDPVRHWPIVFVGLLGKVFGPIGFIMSVQGGRLPWSMGWTILTNDLIWWIPFGAIIWRAWAARHGKQESVTWQVSEEKL